MAEENYAMNTVAMDVKFAFRILRKSPGFVLGAVLALALGIGANTAIFSVVYATLIRSLPYKDADRLVMVWERDIEDPKDQNVANPANFMDWKEQNKVFEDMAAFADTFGHLSGGIGEPEEVIIQYGTPNYFTVLGSKAFLGRTFVASDEKSERVIVISHGLWLRRFGGDRQIIGQTVTLNGEKSKILGVMPPDFQLFIKKNSWVGKKAELWLPYPITPERRERLGRYLLSVARLKPGVTIQQAKAEMDLIGKNLTKQYPDFNTGWGTAVVPIREQLSGPFRSPLFVLTAAVGFVLLIACGNVANLIMVRAMSRSREIAVREAMGAGRWRIVRQLLIESLLLAAGGAVVGLILAYWGLQALQSFQAVYGIDYATVEINPAVLLFTLAISILTAIVFGLVPALQATRWNLQEQLKESSRGVQLGSSRTRNVFVVSEMALALILLVGAGLLIRSFARLVSVDPGFNPKNMVTVRILLPEERYKKKEQGIQYFQKAVERIQSLPGVESAGATTFPPFAGPPSGTDFYIEGRPKPKPGQEPITDVIITDLNFFKAMQIPLKRGRLFNLAETTEAKRVVVINETLAQKYFPNEDPLGKRLKINMRDEPNAPTEIIGIVGDAKHTNLEEPVEPTVFWPHPELPLPFMTLIVRTKGVPTSAIPSIRQAIRSIDPDQPLGEFHLMENSLGATYARNEFNMALLATLAFVAMALSIIGIYGVMSHTVLQRTQEMGIRMALGAQSEDVQRMVLKQAGKLIVSGSLIGLVGAFALTWLMRGMLFGTSPTDGRTMVLVTLTIVAVALTACWIPARRASKVDPATALRYE
jgi:putative ABC transport system permease protein